MNVPHRTTEWINGVDDNIVHQGQAEVVCGVGSCCGASEDVGGPAEGVTGNGRRQGTVTLC